MPPNLIYLTLGNKFNQSIDKLPDNLEILEIGQDFNRPIHKLPKNLKILKFCESSVFKNKILEFPPNLIEFHSREKLQKKIRNFPTEVKCVFLDRKKTE